MEVRSSTFLLSDTDDQHRTSYPLFLQLVKESLWLKLGTKFKWKSTVLQMLHTGTTTHIENESGCWCPYLRRDTKDPPLFAILHSVELCSERLKTYNADMSATGSSLLATCPTSFIFIYFHTNSQSSMQNLWNCLVLCWPWEHNINI